MGYTTKFSGSIKLSRPLTLAEAKELLEIHEGEGDDTRGPKDPQNESRYLYLQWVPTESLDGIVWDGEEKFYSYVECMTWLAAWLTERGIGAAGLIRWAGEDADDHGEIVVVDASVTAKKFERKPLSGSPTKPLTLTKLGEMALAQLTQA
jgi:hypothetical protein